MTPETSESMSSRRRFLRQIAAVSGGVGLSGCATFLDGETADRDAPGPADWSMFDGNAANTRALPDATGPKEPIEVRWQFDAPTDRTYPAAATEDTVFVGSEDANAYALDATTGEERWRFEPGRKTLPTAVSNGTVYIGVLGGGDSNLHALNAETGAEEWHAKASPDGAVSPAVLGDSVIVSSGPKSGTVVAFDASTGKENWRFEEPADGTFEPTVDGDTVYVGSGDTNLYAINASTGEERWRFTGAGSATSPPALLSETLYFGTFGGPVYALDRRTGTEKWRSEEFTSKISPPAVVGDTVYVTVFGDDSVYALDAATGEVRWRFEADGPFLADNWPAVLEDTIYFGGENRLVYGLSTETGAEQWRVELQDGLTTHSLVIEKTLYIGSKGGNNAVYGLT